MKAEDESATTATSADDTARDEDAHFVDDVREALDAGHIFVAYQPIVELGSERLEKVEALARWVHPTRGVIPPSEFIPRAEHTGVIDELGTWTLARACSEIVALRDHGIDIDLNVNFSVVQLRHPAIAERTAEILARSGLAANRLWIELTEGVFLEEEAVGPLMQLHDLGVRLVIDDFGTGFSNFQYISRLPISGLKIDRSFVAGLGVNGSDTAIVRSMTNLGRELGLQVVVEGVETESQRSQLRAINCQLAQGWLFAPALRPSELVARFGSNPASVPSVPVQSVDEAARIAALRACKVLDTAPEPAFDALAQMASTLLDTPMALISLVDVHRQWFKASIGVDAEETARELAFCHHAIASPCSPFIVADALADERFAASPLVTGPTSIRAYAGAPIRTRENLPIGTLCVLDTHARQFTTQQLEQLTMLAAQASALLDLRRRAEELNDLLRTRTTAVSHPLAREIFDAPPVTVTSTSQPRSGVGIQVGTRIVAVDAGALALFAAEDPAEVIGRDIFDFVAPISRPSARSRRAMRTQGGSPGDQLIMLRCLDGTEIMVRMTTEEIDFAGDPARRVTMHEVPDHRFGRMPDIDEDAGYDADDAVIVTDFDFHVLSWSRGAEQLYGWLAPEVLGRSLQDFTPELTRNARRDVLVEMGGRTPWGDAAQLVARDGTVVNARVSMHPLCGPDGVIKGIVMVHRPDREIVPSSFRSGADLVGIR